MLNENSILAVTNPAVLLAGAGIMCLLAWGCAAKYRNTNDFKKSTALYIPAAVILGIGMALFWHIDFLLCAGMGMFGFVVLALISNHYFYH